MTVVDPWIAPLVPYCKPPPYGFGACVPARGCVREPRRTLAATLELSRKTVPVILPAELIPSGQMLLYLSR